MADDTAIEWADATWNPAVGCSVLSPGCTNCYAMRFAHRMGGSMPWSPAGRNQKYRGLTKVVNYNPVWTGDVRLEESALDWPLRRRKPLRIFVNSMSDLFHENLPNAAIDRVFAVMALCPQHTFTVLTKRAARMRGWVSGRDDVRLRQSASFFADWGREHGYPMRDIPLFTWPLPNVWLGVSVEDQARADERIPHLLATPAVVRFISAEPLLGPIDLRAWVPNEYRLTTPRRGWDEFTWPDWVPQQVRDEIASFWQADYGRGPDAWMRGAAENGQPPLGTRGNFPLYRHGEPLIAGRFVPAWNNIGRVIDDSGMAHVISAGHYQSRPPRLDWVIAGGESGPGARPWSIHWARELRDQCAAAGVPFFWKQNGEWEPAGAGPAGEPGRYAFGDYETDRTMRESAGDGRPRHFMTFGARSVMRRVGKKAAGRLLDGREHNEVPA